MNSPDSAPIDTRQGSATSTQSLGLIAAAVVVVATFLPWQRHLLTDSSVSGFGSGGWIAMVAALIAGWRLWALSHGGARRDALIAVVGGLVAVIVSTYALYYFLTNEEGLIDEVRSATPLAGVYMALAGSAVLTLASGAIWRRAR